MSPDVPPSRLAIGATLGDARRRYGLEVREVEERTKIRAKYLRALENEEWDLLPGPTFVKSFLRTYAEALGLDARLLLEEIEPAESEPRGDDEFDPDEDALLGDAIALVVEMGTASTSMLQRRLRLGYTRAGRLIDMLERRGVISGYEGSKPRAVLVGASDLPRVLGNLAERGDAVGVQSAGVPAAPGSPSEAPE